MRHHDEPASPRAASGLTEQQAAEFAAARFERLLASASNVTVLLDERGQVAYISGNVGKVLGHPAEAFVGRPLGGITHPDDLPRLRHRFEETVVDGDSRTVRYRVRHGDGTGRWLEGTLTDHRDDPLVGGVVADVRDVTGQVRAEEEVRFQATHDGLTGLPNRTLVSDRASSAIARAARTGTTFAVLALDLDHFKRTNGTLGHDVGDALLVEVARRLQSRLRAADTLARLGGDEFVILLENISTRDPASTAHGVAQDLLVVLRDPVRVGDQLVPVAASIGIAVHEPGHHASDLLRHADAAMYVAKERGRGQAVVHDERMRANTQLSLHMDSVIREALSTGGVAVDFQPIVSLATGRLVGAEALARLHLGSVRYSPTSFIGAAEESGNIVPLGEVVLHRALEEAVSWPSATYVAVNMSARQLTAPLMAHTVLAALEETGVAPHRLVIEVTETALVEVSDQVNEAMATLDRAGVRVALDDFGTGWSSLSYLRTFPVSIVKVDRSFVSGVARIGSGDTEVVRAVVSLAEALGIEVVAEGIEDEIQAAVLTELGCHTGQGFLYGRPTPCLDHRLVSSPRTRVGTRATSLSDVTVSR